MSTTAATYEAVDMYQSAYLMIAGHGLPDVVSTGSRCVFSFPDSQSLRAAVAEYSRKTAIVNAYEFSTALRLLKGKIKAAHVKRAGQSTSNAPDYDYSTDRRLGR